MAGSDNPRLVVLCTVATGLDAIAEVHRRGYSIAALIGLKPQGVDPDVISGYVDISEFAQSIGVAFHYVETYSLKSDSDRAVFTGLDFDLVWVAGWQRLVPDWLIRYSQMGVLGGHGSPDGIAGGRGRSPQNWALLLGCDQFDLALFRITEGADEGPVVAQRTFFYRPEDDIQVSYYRANLAMGDMICEVLAHPERLDQAAHQSNQAFYYPQRRPEDGMVDWCQPAEVIARHCRALTTPYPGLKTRAKERTLTILKCQPFDDQIDGAPGEVSHCFCSHEFLVNTLDGRLLVRRWTTTDNEWRPSPRLQLESVPMKLQLQEIVRRHNSRYPEKTISSRILRWT